MKKLIKQGAKLAHILIDILAEEIAGGKSLKEKKKSNGKKENHNRSRNSFNSANKHIQKKAVNR
jgi:hypothetical protein